VTITEPEEELACAADMVSPVTCLGGTDGEATVTADGGWGEYTYLWSDGQTTATATGLAAGTYTVTVTDAEGCETVCEVTITEPEEELACSVELISNVTFVNGNDGEATVNAIGGWGEYTYLWSNGQTSATASALVAGTYTVTVTDAEGCETVCEITITEINHPPVARDDINTTHINVPVDGWVLTNDFDPDGDELILNTTPISNPSHGTLVFNSDGSYNYTPNTGFEGKDYFEYQICDPDGLCDNAIVTITVILEREEDENRPPVAVEDNYVGKVNTPVQGNLIANDYDPDGDNISIVTIPVTQPGTGTVIINSDGTFSFIPEEDFTGLVTFIYEICDDGSPSLCATAIVTIDIRDVAEEVNTTIAVDDAYFILEDSTLEGDISLNDYDPEGDNQVDFSLLVPTVNGTMALLPDGSFTYIPYEGFVGNDQFIYEVCDDGNPVACDQATAYIIVEEAPVDTIPVDPGEQEPECELFIPNAFSPNNDGFNDYFEIVCFDDYPNAKLEVYSRWGILLHEQENYGNTDSWGSTDAWWDGSSNKKMTVGKEKLPMGTYFFILYLNDGSDPITGSVFLNRGN